MLAQGYPPHGTSHSPLNYAQVAAGMGLAAIRVTDPADVRPALSTALVSGGPVLVDVVTDPTILSPQQPITVEQRPGIGLGATGSVLAGWVGQMLDAARSNLRNLGAVVYRGRGAPDQGRSLV
jgi:pyruvate dehydrogenase (quinone)